MPDQRITELHAQAPLVDVHCHPSLKLYLFEEEKFDKDNEVPDSSNLFRLRVDIPSLLAGGVRVALSTAHIPEKMLREDCFLLNLVVPCHRHAKYLFAHYIVKHIAAMNPGQAIHLGDVYYAGSPTEIKKHFQEMLSPLLTSLPMYALNANHEMMHNGVPFFEFLQFKHGLGASQPQESTYFCLYNDAYQVIAIDTDYYEHGRHREATLVEWLSARLHEGRAKRKINVLLSQHEPYNPRGVEALLREDLQPLVLDEQLVDLWCWGDEHWAALYRPGSVAPFIGACIGHRGYPSRRQSGTLVAPPAEVA